MNEFSPGLVFDSVGDGRSPPGIIALRRGELNKDLSNVVVNMITFAICDDEPLMARELAGHLAGYMKEKSTTDYSVSSFSNGCALLESGGSFDVIFLDIQMEQPDGMETAKLLRQRGVHSLLIFVSIAAGVLELYAVSRFWMGSQQSVSWLAAVLAFYVSQLSFGIINSVEAALFPRFIGSPLLYLLLLAAHVLFFALCAGCYYAVLKLLAWTEDSQAPNIGLILFPTLFFFAAEMYILQSAYGLYFPSISFEELRNHGVLLALQVMGLAALLCTLYAYRHLCQGFQAQAELQSLTQAAQAQKIYIAEAQARYEQTKSFRHDIKNHLSLLDGLLRGGKPEEGREYLKKLEAVSEALSFPYQTGNSVVDILLGEKLGLAKDLAAEVSLILPKPCGIDDFDLCVLFANALDNAIAACSVGGGAKAIRISGKQQGDFYMLTFENTCSDGPMPPAGTGLSNIKAVAEKYHGAMLTEKADGRFSLNVLLNVSSLAS